jgi:hypothetical protein
LAGGTAPDTYGAHPALMSTSYDAKRIRSIDEFVKADATIDY